jgi:hypothetical protein
MSDDTQPAKAPLLLPAPADPSSSSSDPPTVTFGPQTSFKLDKLGPLVVNSDGVRDFFASLTVGSTAHVYVLSWCVDGLKDQELGVHDRAGA